MTIVVDASVAAKWLVAEDGSDAARAVLASGEPLIAPDLVVAEVGNVLWKKHRSREVTTEQAQTAAATLPTLFDRLVPALDLVLEALILSVEADHPLYDSLYVVLARREAAALATLDVRLGALALREGVPLSPRLTAAPAAPGREQRLPPRPTAARRRPPR